MVRQVLQSRINHCLQSGSPPINSAMKLIQRLLRGLVRRPGRGDEIIARLAAGDFAGATALAARADDLSAQDWLAVCEAAAGRGREAEALLFHALRQGGAGSAFLMACGRWLAGNDEALRAFAFFAAAHRLAPEESAPLAAQGDLHAALGNQRAAAAAFLAAAQRDELDSGLRAKLHQAREAAGLPPLPTGRVAAVEATEVSTGTDAASEGEAAPGDARSLLAHGRWLLNATRAMEAVPILETAHRLDGGQVDTGYWLAAALTMLHRHAEALGLCTTLLQHAATHREPLEPPELRELLALAAESAAMTGDHARAAQWYQERLALDPQADAGIWSNFGNSLARLERFAEAIPPLEQAVALAPQLLDARINLAYALYYAGQTAAAADELDAALRIECNDFDGRWFRAHLHLAAHRFAAGWRDYEFRTVQAGVSPRTVPFPLWRGGDLSGKTLLVTAEQGVGDQIMFVSCLPELMARTGRVILECEARLVPLFIRSFPAAQVVEQSPEPLPTWRDIGPDIDCHLPMGSLPAHFRPDPAAFSAASIPFLCPDPDALARCRERLATIGNGMKVGIAWRGGVALSRTRSRSLSLKEMAPLLRLPGCDFVSLQYGSCTEEIAALQVDTGIDLPHWPERLADLDEFAALTAALDLVVTVCSAPVHFAGALGKPALVLVPYAPEWRYAGIDGRMLWYPDVSLLPQPAPGDWASVLATAARQIAQWRESRAQDVTK